MMRILLIASFLVQSHTALRSRLLFWYFESMRVETIFTIRARNQMIVMVSPWGTHPTITLYPIQQKMTPPVIIMTHHFIFPKRVLIFPPFFECINTWKIVRSIEEEVKSIKNETARSWEDPSNYLDDSHSDIAHASKGKGIFEFLIVWHEEIIYGISDRNLLVSPSGGMLILEQYQHFRGVIAGVYVLE